MPWDELEAELVIDGVDVWRNEYGLNWNGKAEGLASGEEDDEAEWVEFPEAERGIGAGVEWPVLLGVGDGRGMAKREGVLIEDGMRPNRGGVMKPDGVSVKGWFQISSTVGLLDDASSGISRRSFLRRPCSSLMGLSCSSVVFTACVDAAKVDQRG